MTAMPPRLRIEYPETIYHVMNRRESGQKTGKTQTTVNPNQAKQRMKIQNCHFSRTDNFILDKKVAIVRTDTRTPALHDLPSLSQKTVVF
jgi:hypothetical protein